MVYFHPHKKLPPNFDVLIPFKGYENELLVELIRLDQKIFLKNNKIILTENLNSKPIWAQDWWKNCSLHEFHNSKQIIDLLKTQPTLGVYYNSQDQEVKLATKVRKSLRELKVKRIHFEINHPFNFKYFCWTLLEPNLLILSNAPQSKFPLGWHEFEEDKTTAPNRAYLKLWELFTIYNLNLISSDRVIDFGASPGGWSYVLSNVFKNVISIDKAPLDARISKLSNIIYKKCDAFNEKPADYLDYNWFFSDIICTPERLLELVQDWIEKSQIQNYICTIKFKGPCDFNMIDQFLNIDHSKIIHLYQNKNEVTWIRQVKK